MQSSTLTDSLKMPVEILTAHEICVISLERYWHKIPELQLVKLSYL